MLGRKSVEHFDQNRPQLILEKAVQTGDCKGEQNKTSPTFIERNSTLMQSNKSPSGVSNARPVHLTCKNQRHLTQTCIRDSERDHKGHIRSDTLHTYLTPEKIDMRMIHCWSCKELPIHNDQKTKPQSSHIISNEQNPSELHVTQKEKKANIQIDRKLVRTEY